MKKIFFLVCLVVVLTGCKAEVNLVITKEQVSENIKIYDLKENIYDNSLNIKEEVARNIRLFEHEYEHYDKEEFQKDNYVGKIYSFTSDISFLDSISRLRTCYDSIKVFKNEEFLQINTSNEYRCGYIFGADDVVLNISSDLIVNYSNADKIEGNILIWNLNKDNYKNKNISVKYSLKSDEEVNQENEESEKQVTNENNTKIMKYIIFSILLIIIIISIAIFIKIKNSNN